MSYEKTRLWKGAFEETWPDIDADEQNELRGAYLSMRERAGKLVAKIASDLPHMTVHDLTHLDALWEMASLAASDEFKLNPAEAFVFGGAVLLHDAAMTLAAFPGGIGELKQTIEWKDLYVRHSSKINEEDQVAIKEAEQRATDEALRLLHAKQAEKLPTIAWKDSTGEKIFLLENSHLRNFYGPKIGSIAYSHWWSISRVEAELSGTLGSLPGFTTSTVDLLKIACLLRVADAMHLDQRRAPPFNFALTQPAGISADHWRFQERMGRPFLRGDALVYTAQPAFDVELADAWWTAFDALQMVDGELRSVDRVLHDHQKTPLAARRVEGAHSPIDLARTVETIGWVPVDSTVRVSDVPKIVATLGGQKLYGESLNSAIRELIQNGMDAVTARRRLQSRPKNWGRLDIDLRKSGDDYWLIIEDNGVGMSNTVLTGPLIDFGNSFWRSSLAIQEFPGLASAGMKARGKYGIGFFSVFMLGDHVKVISRRYDRESYSGKVLEFRHGLSSRPNLRDIGGDQLPVDGGTRIEVKLNVAPHDEGGMLAPKRFASKEPANLLDLIASIAPATDVHIVVKVSGEVKGEIQAGDWLEIPDNDLLRRISQFELFGVPKTIVPLFEMRDDDGRLFGKARVEHSPWRSSGLVTVDGLAASRLQAVSGIFVGIETTAARNSAKPLVPAGVLAGWATEQASVIQNADLMDAEKAYAAEVILACGGDIGGLPLLWWHEKWLNSDEVRQLLSTADMIFVHLGDISHEEDDDVTSRQFESFEPDPGIAQTSGGAHQRVRSIDWISRVNDGSGRGPSDLLEEILEESWGQFDDSSEIVVVGEVNGVQIQRTVTMYVRLREEESPDDESQPHIGG